MSQSYMSQKDVPQYGAVNFVPAQPLPVYYVTPEPPRRRYTFLKSLIISLALLEAVWFGYHWHLRHWHRSNHGHIHGPGWDIDLDMNRMDHDAEGCAVWDHYDPEHSKSQISEQTTTASSRRLEEGDKFTFSIPTSSERYHFVSWGPIDKSRFEVVPVESDKEQVVAEVEVLKDPRGTARVCVLPSTGDDEKYGVGIYSPRDHEGHGQREWPAFSVKVFVPVSSDGSQRNLNAFETRLGQFEHIIPDLATINFTKVQLSAANVPITIKSVVANAVLVHDANGPIVANITSASQLVLANANSPISANLTLTQAGSIHVSNANGKTDTTVYLKAGDFHPRPDYHLAYSNANSPIELKIAEQPIGSGFFLQASNANGAVSAHVNAAYEGHFTVSGVMRAPTVTLTNRKDPAGEGRERHLQFDKNGSVKEGWIEWSSDDTAEHAPGEVKLTSVLAPVDLFFD